MVYRLLLANKIGRASGLIAKLDGLSVRFSLYVIKENIQTLQILNAKFKSNCALKFNEFHI